ncbi:hypothetical protein [Stieleria sedimenti]|uniref:hypothetical protein n=1 Tax=Stieleria sedimenti TaxID=2976331 RepID=UPI002B2063F6|nr:hypothetical protein [Stieleria sedimenti]
MTTKQQAATVFFEFLSCFVASVVHAQGIVTLQSVPAERELITADEPLAERFSAKQSAIYLDRAALTWQKEKKCVTCHTNMLYLFARPALASIQQDSGRLDFQSARSDGQIGAAQSDQ